MTCTATLLRVGPDKSLAKIWAADGRIIPAANGTWFEGKEIPFASVRNICQILHVIERWPRVALVKEAIARGVDANRLRRRCSSGVDEHTGEPFQAGLVVVPRTWIVLDIEKLPRPPSMDFNDGARLAAYARDRLPHEFKPAACVWQLSGSPATPRDWRKSASTCFSCFMQPYIHRHGRASSRDRNSSIRAPLTKRS